MEFVMNLIFLVIVIALVQYIYFSVKVGMAREKYGVKAPAMTGNEFFERQLRVQMNTLELMICIIPALLISAQFWSPLIMALIGFVYVIGRFIYSKTYVVNPDKRTIGFALSMLPILILLIAALIGIVKNLI